MDLNLEKIQNYKNRISKIQKLTSDANARLEVLREEAKKHIEAFKKLGLSNKEDIVCKLEELEKQKLLLEKQIEKMLDIVESRLND